MIKPDFFSNESLTSVSLEARLLFIGTWCFADDYGFFLNSPRRILGDVFPIDTNVTEQKVAKWIGELVSAESLIPIEYKNKRLLLVKGWHHQKVAHKSKRSHVHEDDLQQVIEHSLDSREDLVKVYLESHAPKRKKKEERESKKEESNKVPFGSHVFLSTDEYQKVIEKYGTEEWAIWSIEVLNNYKASNGKKYKSDYHVLIGWVFDKWKGEGNRRQDTREQRDYGL
jgi:hypothetical protein